MARQKRKKTIAEESIPTTQVTAEPILDYVPQREIEKEEKKKKLGLII